MNLLGEQKAIGLITIVSGLLALASLVAVLFAVNFNNDALSDPVLVLTTPGSDTVAARWSMILDMLGYYLLLLPVIYLCKDWMRERSPWSDLVAFCGVAYILIGSIGASVLAVVWPNIIDAFQLADSAEKQILKADFKLINDAVYGGLWNLLEMAFAAIWWGFTGFQLIRNGFKWIGWTSFITGISCLGDMMAGVFKSVLLHEISLNIYLLLAIVWAIAMGVFLLKAKLK